MSIESDYLVQPGKKLNLPKLKSNDTGDFKDETEVQDMIDKNLKKLRKQQDMLYAQSQYAVLIVLQAMDTAGKDGSIKHVFSGVNPQGCAVASFKAPTKLELAHDFLWRIHAATPAKGMIGIFNRSHYESVLVERVHELVPKKVWSRRYDQINAFENMLANEGTLILKFFLNISKAEQKRRLQSRLDDPKKNWKFDPNDLKEREHWDEYMEAYEDALRECSTEQAPWYVVPSDCKWYRNYVISDTIVRALDKLDLAYPPPAEGIEGLKII